MNNQPFFSKSFLGALLGLLLASSQTYADCPTAKAALDAGNESLAVESYSRCAIDKNDDASQIWLGRYYQTNMNRSPKDTMKMLLYYHLSAENGNANAQVALAKILTKMDSSDEMRTVLASYMEQIKQVMESKKMPFKGEMLHPYLLLTLAAEDADQKWYYPTDDKTNVESVLLLKSYSLPENRVKALLYEGSLWKQRKMAETAKEVMKPEQYEQFMDTIYPKQGKADPFARKRAVNDLKERVEQYLR